MTKGTEPIEEFFDYVVVCNGHFTLPYIPAFEGREDFKGTQIHMHELRKLEPKDFDDKNVLIIGNWVSANDLVINLLFRKETKDLVHPKNLYITGKNTTTFEISEDYSEARENGRLKIRKGNVSKITEDSVIFGDGNEEKIDTIIYATGYKYCMPFFDPNDGIIEFDSKADRGFYFGPLYKKMF